MHVGSSAHTSPRISEHYVYAIVAMIGTLLAVLVLYWGIADSRLAPWARSFSGVVGPMSNTIGVLFGLTLAFIANDTWTAHDRARGLVLQEGDSLRALLILSEALEAPTRADVCRETERYIDASTAEWALLADGTTSASATRSADRLLRLVSAPTVVTETSTTIQQAMLQLVTAIRTSRNQRIGLSRTHVNPLKWLGMAFLGFLTLLSIAVIHVDAPRAALAAMVLFAAAAAPTAAIVLIHGNPFHPPSAVSRRPIAAALTEQAAAALRGPDG